MKEQIECLKVCFAVLCRQLGYKLHTSTLIIISCAILHNVVLGNKLVLQLKDGYEIVLLSINYSLLVAVNNRLGNVIKTAFIKRHFT